ncbi:MAG: glycerol-3-phosphate dehydrogenase/oxidase [Acidobacteria bacterium]|nr:glycerol-3-phosphate dehydrogenase/oxidase [Acidobacteriota bacterium]
MSLPNRRFTSGGEFDVLVIGGGIVGAGVARDASMRGLRTMLVEQADFASGTSSRSSRLLHGGIRYLAQGRIGLVREASVEKMRLHDVAPHLASPLPFVFPAWQGCGWPRWKLAIGVRLYDLLCGRISGGSEGLSRDQVLARAPGLREVGLTGGVRYFDALTNDARLVLDTLHSAEDAGANVANYVRFVGCSDAGATRRCELLDTLTGEPFTVTARSVVDAAGAWAGGLQRSSVRLRLTKGVHLVIDRGRLPVADAVVLPEGDRILFVIPWGERAIIGTTDTDFSGNPEDVTSGEDDVAYLLRAVNSAFPAARITGADLVSTWAGVRPLIAPRHGRAGAPSDLSRSHQIRMSEPGWFDIAGGKLTTYRLMAERTVDRVCEHLRGNWRSCTTAATPLRTPAAAQFSSILPPAFGPEAVEFYCRREWVVHLDDVLLRRTSWHFYEKNAGQLALYTAHWMAEWLGWDAKRAGSELRRYSEQFCRLEIQDSIRRRL